MEVNFKDFIEIIVGAIAIGTLIHRISESKSKLERNISELNLGLERKIAESNLKLERKIDALNHKLDIHVAKVDERGEFSEYIINAIDKKIDHKFQRIWDNVREIQQFLEKKLAYTIRSH